MRGCNNKIFFKDSSVFENIFEIVEIMKLQVFFLELLGLGINILNLNL